MRNRQQSTRPGRRRFLQSALGSVAAVAAPLAGAAPEPVKSTEGAPMSTGVDPDRPRPAGPIAPSQEFTARDEGVTYSSCGGDYMVDVMRSLGIEYFAATSRQYIHGSA